MTNVGNSLTHRIGRYLAHWRVAIERRAAQREITGLPEIIRRDVWSSTISHQQ